MGLYVLYPGVLNRYEVTGSELTGVHNRGSDIPVRSVDIPKCMVPVVDDHQVSILPLNHTRIADITIGPICGTDWDLMAPALSPVITQPQADPGAILAAIGISQSQSPIIQLKQRRRCSVMPCISHWIGQPLPLLSTIH